MCITSGPIVHPWGVELSNFSLPYNWIMCFMSLNLWIAWSLFTSLLKTKIVLWHFFLIVSFRILPQERQLELPRNREGYTILSIKELKRLKKGPNQKVLPSHRQSGSNSPISQVWLQHKRLWHSPFSSLYSHLFICKSLLNPLIVKFVR